MIALARTRLSTLLAGIILLTGLAGCGSTTSSQSANTLLSQVEKTKQLTVALSSFAPLEFQSPTTKQWTGFDINFLAEFAKTLGAKLVVQSMPFASTIESVSSKRADVTANIFKTAQRSTVIQFSLPVLKYQEGVIVNSVHPAVTQDSAQSLAHLKIATCRGCAEQSFFNKLPSATDVAFGTVAESFLAVSDNRVAADLQPVMYAQWAMKENPGLHIKILGPTPNRIAGGAAAPKGYYGVPQGTYSQSFLQKLNAFIKQSKKNGTTAKLLAKYGLTSSSYLQGLGY